MPSQLRIPPSRVLLVPLLLSCGGNVQSSPDPNAAGGVSGATTVIATGGTTSGSGGAVGGTGGATTIGPSPCQLPAEPGNCDAYMPSFYFDVKHGTCQPFVYGGCGGNANRFASLEACVDACDPGGLDRCVNDSSCSVTSNGCCGACEPVKISDFAARNVFYAIVENCPGVACGACPPFDGTPNAPNFAARCVAGRCQLYDVRE